MVVSYSYCLTTASPSTSQKASCASNLVLLGHHLDPRGVRPLSSKINAVQSFPRPTTVTKLRQFLGMVNFYCKVIKNCANIVAPLDCLLTSKDNRMSLLPWNDTAEDAFIKIKGALASAAFLAHPYSTAPLALMSNESSTPLGAVLQQRVSNSWQPLVFFSKKLSPTQARYNIFGRLEATRNLPRHSTLSLFCRRSIIHHFHTPQAFHICTFQRPVDTRAMRNPPSPVYIGILHPHPTHQR